MRYVKIVLSIDEGKVMRKSSGLVAVVVDRSVALLLIFCYWKPYAMKNCR